MLKFDTFIVSARIIVINTFLCFTTLLFECFVVLIRNRFVKCSVNYGKMLCTCFANSSSRDQVLLISFSFLFTDILCFILTIICWF